MPWATPHKDRLAALHRICLRCCTCFMQTAGPYQLPLYISDFKGRKGRKKIQICIIPQKSV